MQRDVRVVTDNAKHPMTIREIRQFLADADAAGADDSAPVKFENTLKGRSRAISTSISTTEPDTQPLTRPVTGPPREINIK